MAFSILDAFKLYVLLLMTCSCVFAGTKSMWQGYANPYMLVRLKRSPQRAFTFSGFDPTNGLAAFATSADFLPYYQYPSSLSQVPYPRMESRGETFAPSSNALSAEYKPPAVEFKPPSTDYQPSSVDFKPPSSEYTLPSQDYKPPSFDYKPPNSELQGTPDYTSFSVLDEEQKAPAQNLTPPSEVAPSSSYDLNPVPVNKKPKKKPTFVAPATTEDEDEEEGTRGKSRSSSSASFNAWFPIVLGMYPSAQPSRTVAAAESLKDAPSAAVKEQPIAGGLGTTVIANSVSHGKSSVASSHAIAYGGDAPSHAQSYRNKG